MKGMDVLGEAAELTRLGAGMSHFGERAGGQNRRVKPNDIIIVPAGTPHGFSQLGGPIGYLVYPFPGEHPREVV